MFESNWARLSGLLDELFELAPEACAARLAEIERDDARLAAELRRLLAADERSGVLEGGVARAAPTALSELIGSAPGEPPQAQAGKRVGHYRLIERIGTGGMGEVWLGKRVDDFEQQVAVKLIRPLFDGPQLRERFARERRILARLDHPGIARLLDGGVVDDGTPWYAMEFVQGVDIVRYANQHALDVRARVALLLQACDALAYAQAQLVVHRDIKPSNILVDDSGRLRLLDFGIARLLDDSGAEALTGTGVRVFSPAYAAPEQIRGEPVGTAADVFALGAVLYELIVGTPPHPERSAAPDRLMAGLAGESAPHPARALREMSRGAQGARTTTSARSISADLDTVVATALQPEAARRYAGAAQLADDLRRWLDGRPIAARPDTASYRMKRFVARHRFAVGSASAVLLALIAGLGAALWQARVAHDHAVRAEQQTGLARMQAERTRKVKEFMVSVFHSADPMRRDVDAPQTIDAAFDAALQRARTELGEDPVLQADVLDDFGEIRTNQGRFDDARPLFEQALAVAEKAYGVDHPIVAETLGNLAVLSFLTGRMDEASRHIERAVAILERDDGGDPFALPVALTNLTAVQRHRGELNAMRRTNARALRLYRERAPGDARMIPILSNAALLAAEAGRHDEALPLFDEVIALIEREHGPESPTLWSVLSSMAKLEHQRGNPDSERAHTERALALARANFTGDHPWTANSLADLGLQRVRMGEAGEGEAQLRESIAMFDRLSSADVVPPLRYLALALIARDDLEGAAASLDRALAVCDQFEVMASRSCVMARASRAALLARAGQGEAALREVDAAAGALPNDPALVSERGQIMEARAVALAALGRSAEALAEQNAVIALWRERFGTGHPETRRAEKARAALEQAVVNTL